MGNGGFVYDKTRQEFRKVTHSIWHFVRMGLKYLVLTLTLSILYYVVFSLFISTDTERRLIRENRLYSKLYPSLEEKEKLVGDVVQSLQVRDNAIYTEIFGTGAPSAEGLNPAEILSVADSTRDSDIVLYADRKLDSLVASAARIEAGFARIFERMQDRKSLPPMTLPLEKVSPAQTGASTGMKLSPFLKVRTRHTGLDLLSPQGERVLATADDVGEDLVDVGHVEVAAQHQVARRPVVAAQERVYIFHAALARGAVAQMAHIQLAHKRQVDGRSAVHQRVVDVVADAAEDLADGIAALGALAIDIFLAWSGVRVDAAHTGRLLTAVVLLLHQQVQQVQAIQIGSILVFVILQGLAQLDHCDAAFVFQLFGHCRC